MVLFRIPGMRQRSRSAFTLIELLVVIAIIAILAAILFPIFAQARDKARQAACLSNSKQIALGVAQYVQDYDEMYPTIDYGRYLILCQPYIKSEKVWECPDATGWYRIIAATNLFNPPVDRWIKVGWAANGDVFGGFNQTTAAEIALGAGPKSSTLDKEPASCVLLAEADADPTTNLDVQPTGTTNTAQVAFSACMSTQQPWYAPRWNVGTAGSFPTISGGRLGAHHQKGMNVVYSDFHAHFSKNPPEDCHNYMSAMPVGSKLITGATADKCRPTGATNAYCYTQ